MIAKVYVTENYCKEEYACGMYLPCGSLRLWGTGIRIESGISGNCTGNKKPFGAFYFWRSIPYTPCLWDGKSVKCKKMRCVVWFQERRSVFK